MRPIRLAPAGTAQLADPESSQDETPDPDASTGKGSTWLSADALFGGRWTASQRARRAIYILLFLEIGLVIGFAAIYKPFDLNIYLWGGRAVTHGLRLYHVEVDNNWFTYPPFAAAVFTPLNAVPVVIVRLLWELGTIAALAWACVLTLRLAGYRPDRMVVLAMTAVGFVLEPIYHTLFLGQVNVFLMTLCMFDVWLVSRGRTAGIGVGIATAVKLVPGIFVLYFLVTRRWKAALVSSATFVACGVIGYLVNPADSHLYWTKLFYDTSRVSAPYISNQSPYALAVRLLGGVAHVGAWYYVVPLVLGAAGMAVAVTLTRRQDWLGAATVTGVTGLLVSPISWTHHWVWILPALVVMLRGGKAARISAVCGFVVFVLAPMWFTPRTHTAGQFGFHWVLTLIANSFMIPGVAFLAYMVVITYLPRYRDRGHAGPGTQADDKDQGPRLRWARIEAPARRLLLRTGMTAR
jgi:hypothetical protein